MTEIVPLLDGKIDFDPRLIGAVREASDEAARLLGHDILPPHIEVPVWCYLIRTNQGVGLVDTGSGRFFGGDPDRLQNQIEAEGHSAAEIRWVWLTHLHGDHVGGLLSGNCDALFPEARIALCQSEADHWLKTRHSGNAADIARDAGMALAPYAGRIDYIAPGDDIGGATAIAAFGHTPGHIAWHFPALSAIAAGDIVHLPRLQLHNLDWSSDWDFDPAQAARSRTALIARAKAENLTLLTGHAGRLTF